MSKLQEKHQEFLAKLKVKLEAAGEKLVRATFPITGGLEVILTNDGHLQSYTILEDNNGVFFFRSLGHGMNGEQYT